MTAAHSVKEQKYDPTRTTARIARVGLFALAAAEVVTWLKADRAEGLLPLLVLVLGVVASPLFAIVCGTGLIHDARYGDTPSVDDLLGLTVPWALAAALAIYSGANFATFALGILMLSVAALLRVIRTDRRAAE